MRATPLPRHPYAQASSVEPLRLIHWMLQQNDPIRPTLSRVAMRWRGQRCLRCPQHLPRGTAQYARTEAKGRGERARRCVWLSAASASAALLMLLLLLLLLFKGDLFFGLYARARARTPACVACVWWDRRSHVELPAVRMLARLRSDPRSPEIIDKERSASRKHRCVLRVGRLHNCHIQ